MLGIADPWVAAAYLGCILVTLICLVYGLLRRHVPDDQVTELDRAWALEERKVEDEI